MGLSLAKLSSQAGPPVWDSSQFGTAGADLRSDYHCAFQLASVKFDPKSVFHTALFILIAATLVTVIITN